MFTFRSIVGVFLLVLTHGADLQCEVRNYAKIEFGEHLLSPGWWLHHLADAYADNPYHMVVELIFVILVIWVSLKRQEKAHSLDLTEKEYAEIVAAWQPQPLVPPVPVKETRKYTVESAIGPTLTISGGQEVLNFISYNYLGFANHPQMVAEAERTIKKFAVGSCGPRGFYGTMDVHLNLEEKLAAKFTQKGEEALQAVIYADWLGVPSSVVTAFAKKGDLIIADNNISFLWKQGIIMSRAKVIYFEHNNMESLQEILRKQAAEDKMNPQFKLNRRLILVEGCYENTGQIVDLPQVVEMKNEYKYRLVVDDSNGLGTLDVNGIAGYHNVSFSEIDVYVSAMDKTLGSIGGFVVGNDEITKRQQLYSFGYVFSASAPPFQVNCASFALDLFKRDLTSKLNENIKQFHLTLKRELKAFKCLSHSDSPLIVLTLDDNHPKTNDSNAYETIRDFCLANGLAIFSSSQLPPEKYTGRPYIRLSVTVDHTKEMLHKAIDILRRAEQTFVR